MLCQLLSLPLSPFETAGAQWYDRRRSGSWLIPRLKYLCYRRGRVSATVSNIAQKTADKIEITEVLYKYGKALDACDKRLLANEVFIADAVWEGRVGLINGATAIADMVSSILGALESSLHYISNAIIELDGDCATSTCYLHSVLYMPDQRTGENTLELGAVYHDHHVRTERGWRIARRRLEFKWQKGNYGIEAESIRRVAAEAAAAGGQTNEYAQKRLDLSE